jgi:hypothetical protein
MWMVAQEQYFRKSEVKKVTVTCEVTVTYAHKFNTIPSPLCNSPVGK